MIRTPLCLISLLFVCAAAVAAPQAAPSRTITVTGTGTAKAVPDEARFTAGVSTQAATAVAALAANNQAMAAAIAALKRQGVPDRSIQTENLSLAPQYQTCRPNTACPRTIIGYVASNTVAVTVPLDKAGPVLDALVASGANQIGGIAFAIHDPAPLLAEARASAVRDAIAKAQLYARTAGVSLGPIQEITEAGSVTPRPMARAMAFPDANIGEALRLIAGEETISASVTITWSLN